MSEDRYCSNCRTEIPPGDAVCPACGVYAGDLFDGRMPADRRKRRRLIFLVCLLFVIALGAWALSRIPLMPLVERMTAVEEAPTPEAPSARVVGDRPGGSRRGEGASLTEAEAIRLLRRELVAGRRISDDCIALMSRGYEQGVYTITAFDRCGNVRLGEWTVDGRSGDVKLRSVKP